MVAGKSPYRPCGLLLRCRFFPSWVCSSTQGWGCSPIKGERELGLDRRETGWLLSNGSVSSLRGRWLQYERNELSVPLVDQLSDRALLGSYALWDKGWKHLKPEVLPENRLLLRTWIEDLFDGVGMWASRVFLLSELFSPLLPIVRLLYFLCLILFFWYCLFWFERFFFDVGYWISVFVYLLIDVLSYGFEIFGSIYLFG